MTCRTQHLGPWLEGQGHSPTLQQNRVRPPRKILGEHIVAALSVRQCVRQSVSPSVSPSVRPIRVRPITPLFKVKILKLFYRNDHHVETTCRTQNLGPWLEGQGHSATLQQNRVRPITLLFEVGFQKYFTKWSPYWGDMSHATCRSLLWRSRSQIDLAAKSCPAHNFVIWSQTSKQFHRNDHHIETTCRVQHLACYLEGQGHSKTFQQNCVRPITLFFEVRFRNNFTEMIIILRQRVARYIWVAFWRSSLQHDLSA